MLSIALITNYSWLQVQIHEMEFTQNWPLTLQKLWVIKVHENSFLVFFRKIPWKVDRLLLFKKITARRKSRELCSWSASAEHQWCFFYTKRSTICYTMYMCDSSFETKERLIYNICLLMVKPTSFGKYWISVTYSRSFSITYRKNYN
jgi:hypothetical protein